MQTQEAQDSLSASIEKQHTEAQLRKDYLDSERRRVQQLADQLETDKTRARTERQLLRQSSDLERARLEAEHKRQLMEWAELEKERRHQLTLRQNDSTVAQQHLVSDCDLLFQSLPTRGTLPWHMTSTRTFRLQFNGHFTGGLG